MTKLVWVECQYFVKTQFSYVKSPIFFLNKQGLEKFKSYLKHENLTEQSNKNRHHKLKKQKSKNEWIVGELLHFPPPRTAWTGFWRPKRRFFFGWESKFKSFSLSEEDDEDEELCLCTASLIFSTRDSARSLIPSSDISPPTIQQLINSTQLKSNQFNANQIHI